MVQTQGEGKKVKAASGIMKIRTVVRTAFTGYDEYGKKVRKTVSAHNKTT
jgi:hypothetical protein